MAMGTRKNGGNKATGNAQPTQTPAKQKAAEQPPVSPITPDVGMSREETNREKEKRKVEEDEAADFILSMIEPYIKDDMTKDESERSWKGGARVVASQVYMYSHFTTPRVRWILFEALCPERFQKVQTTKQKSWEYFENQFRENWTSYREGLASLAMRFKESPAGILMQDEFDAKKDALERVKHTTVDASGEEVTFSLPSEFVPDFNPIQTTRDLLIYKGEPGIEFTSYHLVDLHKRPLNCLLTEDIPAHKQPPKPAPPTMGWLSGKDKDYWLEANAASTLRDLGTYLMLEGFTGHISESRVKETRFTDCVWRNRSPVPDEEVMFPEPKDWDRRIDHFGARCYMAANEHPSILKCNNIHKYFLDPATVDILINKHSRNLTEFGKGTEAAPFTAINKQSLSTTGDLGPKEKQQAMTIKSDLDAYVADDGIFEKRPDFTAESIADQQEATRRTCNDWVNKLNKSGVMHPFNDPTAFGVLVQFFTVITTPLESQRTQMSDLFAQSTFAGKMKLTKQLACHAQVMLAEIGQRFKEEALSMEEDIEECDAAIQSIANMLSFLDDMKNDRVTRKNVLKVKQKELKAAKASHDHMAYGIPIPSTKSGTKMDDAIQIEESEDEGAPVMPPTPSPAPIKKFGEFAVPTIPAKRLSGHSIRRGSAAPVDHREKDYEAYESDYPRSRHKRSHRHEDRDHYSSSRRHRSRSRSSHGRSKKHGHSRRRDGSRDRDRSSRYDLDDRHHSRKESSRRRRSRSHSRGRTSSDEATSSSPPPRQRESSRQSSRRKDEKRERDYSRKPRDPSNRGRYTNASDSREQSVAMKRKEYPSTTEPDLAHKKAKTFDKEDKEDKEEVILPGGNEDEDSSDYGRLPTDTEDELSTKPLESLSTAGQSADIPANNNNNETFVETENTTIEDNFQGYPDSNASPIAPESVKGGHNPSPGSNNPPKPKKKPFEIATNAMGFVDINTGPFEDVGNKEG